jgi:hypothetical protein
VRSGAFYHLVAELDVCAFITGYLSDTNTSTYAVPEQLLSVATSAFSFSRPVPAPVAYPNVAAAAGMSLPLPAYRSEQDVSVPSGAATVRPSLQPVAAGGLHHGGGSREMFSLLHGGMPTAVDDSGVYSALPGTPSYAGGMEMEDVQLNEISRESLTFVEKIGEGLFGEVTRN